MFLKMKLALGAQAVPEIARDPQTGVFALRLQLDPGVLVITVAAGPDGPRDFATFMARLSNEAALLAVSVDPTVPSRERATAGDGAPEGPLARWFSASGAGGFGPEVGQ